jgi:uracil-DNA glycosylase
VRVAIVGEAPSRETRGLPPFSGRSGSRLARLAELDPGALGDHFLLVNLLSGWPGQCGKGSAFPVRRAARAADRVLPMIMAEGVALVVLAGRRVQAALGLGGPGRPFLEWDHFAPWSQAGFSHAVLPHPSGVNHWWNDPANEALAGRFLRSLVEGGGPGP